MSTVETVMSDALLLPADKRLTLAHFLLASVEPEVEPETEAAWDQEIRRRIEAYDNHPEGALDATKVLAELKRRLQK